MLLNSWCDSCGPLTVQCWVIQTDAYHCSIPRGEIWTAISIQEWPCFLHPPSSPASHKHIAAGTHTWPVSLNTSSTCIHSGLNQYFCGVHRGICNVKSLMLRKFWCELCKFVLHLNFSSYLTKWTEQTKNLPPTVGQSERQNVRYSTPKTQKWKKRLKYWRVPLRSKLLNLCSYYISIIYHIIYNVMQALLSGCQHFASQSPEITQKPTAVSQSYWKPEYRLGENFTYNNIYYISDVNLRG